MTNAERLETVRRKLIRVAGATSLESLPSALESMGGGPLESALELTGGAGLSPELLTKVEDGAVDRISALELGNLEAIVERTGRPVSFIQRDAETGKASFLDLPDPWTHFNSGRIRENLDGVLAAVGRVEFISPNGRGSVHIGSGFIVGERLMMTNRHVAKAFVRGVGEGRRLVFLPGRKRGINFGREVDTDLSDPAASILITGIRMVHPFWDMALLETASMPAGLTPLTLSTRSPEELEGEETAAIGYPGRGNDRSPEAVKLEQELYGDIFGVKRIAPGEIRGRETVTSFSKPVSAMVHDLSTLAGMSGSCLIDPLTGEVVGLHFAGITLRANYSVPTYELARDPRVVDAGVNFAPHNVAATGEWEPLWRNLESTEGGPPRRVVVPASPGVTPAAPPPQPAAPAAMGGGNGGEATWVIPIHITIGIGAPGGQPGIRLAPPEGADLGLEAAAPRPDLSGRGGYDPGFLDLDEGKDVPLPELTRAGKAAAAPLLSGGGHELKYHHYSLVMHKKRRLALFSAANLWWEEEKHQIGGHKPSRAELNSGAERWLTDDRIHEDHQLPEVFYDRDNRAFDKGHLVRREDIIWSGNEDMEDLQTAHRDSFFTTNCSPQVAGYNQSSRGEYNWGDLENMIQKETSAEKAILFSGPVLSPDDYYFNGRIRGGEARVQIPRGFWKIIVTRAGTDALAYGFLLTQDLAAVPLEPGFEELALPDDWKRLQVPIQYIEDHLSGLLDLSWCRERDAYET